MSRRSVRSHGSGYVLGWGMAASMIERVNQDLSFVSTTTTVASKDDVDDNNGVTMDDTSDDDTLCHQILDYMFRSEADKCLELWFGGDESIVEEIKSRFTRIWEKAIRGELAHWETHPQRAVALCILLDQFSRVLLRDTWPQRIFWVDCLALNVAISALDRHNRSDDDFVIPPLYRVFVLWPLAHSEDIHIHRRLMCEWSNVSNNLARTDPLHVFDHVFGARAAVIDQHGRFASRDSRLLRAEVTDDASLRFELPLVVSESAGLRYVPPVADVANSGGFVADSRSPVLRRKQLTTSRTNSPPVSNGGKKTCDAYFGLRSDGGCFMHMDFVAPTDAQDLTQLDVSIHPRAAAVLKFVFDESMDANIFLWFSKSSKVLKRIRTHFSDDVDRAIRGEYMLWSKRSVAEGTALLILLCPFVTALYRNSLRMYWSLSLACQVAETVLDELDISEVNVLHLFFILLPLSMSESVKHQHRCMTVWSQAVSRLPLEDPIRCVTNVFAHHWSIVERFDRFPHRNILYDRAFTASEIDLIRERGFVATLPLSVSKYGYKYVHVPTATWSTKSCVVRSPPPSVPTSPHRPQFKDRAPDSARSKFMRSKSKDRNSLKKYMFVRGNFGEIDSNTINRLDTEIERLMGGGNNT